MATFDPQFAHDILLPIAEAAYLQTLASDSLPSDYTVVGQITADTNKAQALAATAPANHQAMIQNLMSDGNFFGWVVENTQAKIAVVAFRGTLDLEDWLHNIDVLLTSYQPVANYGTVHKGFQLYYMTVRDSVLSLLKQIDSSCNRLIVTGHSLGAALSELAAPDIFHNGQIGNASISLVPEVQNFAGPRVGQHDFASIFDVQIDVCFRVVNIWDIVPNVPPPLIFEHAGLAVRIDGGFTLDELVAHSLEKSYGPGLLKLIPASGAPLPVTAIPNAATAIPNGVLIGREP